MVSVVSLTEVSYSANITLHEHCTHNTSSLLAYWRALYLKQTQYTMNHAKMSPKNKGTSLCNSIPCECIPENSLGVTDIILTTEQLRKCQIYPKVTIIRSQYHIYIWHLYTQQHVHFIHSLSILTVIFQVDLG